MSFEIIDEDVIIEMVRECVCKRNIKSLKLWIFDWSSNMLALHKIADIVKSKRWIN